MKSPSGDRLLLGMHTALLRLSEADSTDEDVAWNLTADFLAALYRCDEAEHKADRTYYQHRNADPEGAIVAALIRLRAQVDHDGRSDVRHLEWLPAPEFSRVHGGEWVAAPTVARVHGGEWTPSPTSARAWVWPTTPPTDLPKHPGPAATYSREIAGRPVIEVATRAEHYFQAR